MRPRIPGKDGNTVSKNGRKGSRSFDLLQVLSNQRSYSRKALGFKDLKAVKSGRILEIDHNLLDRQGPRLTEGLGIWPECCIRMSSSITKGSPKLHHELYDSAPTHYRKVFPGSGPFGPDNRHRDRFGSRRHIYPGNNAC